MPIFTIVGWGEVCFITASCPLMKCHVHSLVTFSFCRLLPLVQFQLSSSNGQPSYVTHTHFYNCSMLWPNSSNDHFLSLILTPTLQTYWHCTSCWTIFAFVSSFCISPIFSAPGWNSALCNTSVVQYIFTERAAKRKTGRQRYTYTQTQRERVCDTNK